MEMTALLCYLAGSAVLVGVEARIRPVKGKVDIRLVVAGPDLLASRFSGFRHAVKASLVHRVAVAERGYCAGGSRSDQTKRKDRCKRGAGYLPAYHRYLHVGRSTTPKTTCCLDGGSGASPYVPTMHWNDRRSPEVYC